MKQRNISPAAGAREPLRAELREYLDKGGLFKHPLLLHLVHDKGDCGQLHQLIDQKQALVQRCFEHGEWSYLLLLHERWYRFTALCSYARRMDDKTFWRCFGDVWHDSEDIRGNRYGILKLLDQNRPHRERMMTKKERRALQQLPETITIYRGYSYPNAKRCWSWTLSLHHAKWFAKRFVLLSGSPATVAVGEARTIDVVALLQRGDGGTIVIDPSDVKIRKLLRVKDQSAT